MKSKLPIIRVALEAGLTLEFRTQGMNELMTALGAAEDAEWPDVEMMLPCRCIYSAGSYYLEGIEKKGGAGNTASETDAMAFVRAFSKWVHADCDRGEGTDSWLFENLVPMADKILANSGEGAES